MFGCIWLPGGKQSSEPHFVQAVSRKERLAGNLKTEFMGHSKCCLRSRGLNWGPGPRATLSSVSGELEALLSGRCWAGKGTPEGWGDSSMVPAALLR